MKGAIIIRLKYSYKTFPDFPEATEVSRSRAESQAYQIIFNISIFLFSIIFLDSKDAVISIVGIIISIVWWIYLIMIYNKKTEKMIREAKERDKERKKSNDQRKAELKKSNYVVGYDIPDGSHIFTATNPLGGMVHIFSDKGKPLDRIYVKNKKKIKLKSGTTVKLFDCIIDSFTN